MARQLLQSLGIKIAFGGVQNDEVAVVIVTIFLTGFLIPASFQFVNYISGLVIVQNMITKVFLLCDFSFHGFHFGANIT